jgi:cytochrome b561
MTAGAARWPLSMRLLHWLGAATILLMLALGFIMVNFVAEPGRRFDLYQWHKSLGLFVLGLMLVRILCRFARPAPLRLPATPLWRDRAARAMHGLLYALTIALALAGYAMVSSSPLPLPVALPFGLHAPNLLAPDYGLSERFKAMHHVLAALLALSVTGHVAAALKRHFIDCDGTLRRMRPF